MLALGANPEDIVYSHPCKPRSHIAFAKSQGAPLRRFEAFRRPFRACV